MDIVYIKGLKAQAVIGIYDWERTIRQQLVVDLELGTDIRSAAETEDVSNTLDYKAISDRLIEFIETSEYQLVETLAEKLATLLLAEFPVKGVRLRLGKPGAVAAAEDVGVVICRGASL
ncbi:MAG: dihydroneopterin aldolase [Motiliproteus sp.]|nr:dihydroneopterin aldolase [Motiliproteus sp.]MCW9053065.1 dihydroneopterin aldolase [Motiliproteus sp.]